MTLPALARYAAEALGTAVLMVAIATGVILLEHPDSALHGVLATLPSVRRMCMGAGMGMVIAALSYSPVGRVSGAHLNPAFTLGMLRAGRIGRRDAAGYVAAQFVGATLAMALAKAALGAYLAHPHVGYATTVPQGGRVALAFAVEAAMSFALMALVLLTGRSARLAPYTGLLVGALIGVFIWAAGPLTGMSLNPARTVSAALVAERWTALWLYFVAPSLGMLAAAQACGAPRLARAGR